MSIGILPWQEVWDAEAKARQGIDVKTICTFGIKPLDDALVGILKNDLIVIGADSGTGKSELVLDIAINNARAGKRVALYYIEGGEEEAIARIKWKLIKDRYFSNPDRIKNLDMDYRKWRMNMIDLSDLEAECRTNLDMILKDRLHIYKIDSEFTIQSLVYSLGYFGKWDQKGEKVDYNVEIDLIIVDHLQYFTLTNPKNELQEMTNILKTVKEITELHKIPVILVSHLRKKDKDRGLPNQEDFYGTSNTAKIASQAIVITPSFGGEDNNKYPTFFRFVKSRTGLKQNYAVLCNFDIKKQAYEENYQIYQLKNNFPDAGPMDLSKYPRWATVRPKSEHSWQD